MQPYLSTQLSIVCIIGDNLELGITSSNQKTYNVKEMTA